MRRVVTALGTDRLGRVLVELDGEPWRPLPTEVVAALRLSVGDELDRPRLRVLRRELRRWEAVSRSVRALSRRDLSAAALSERLARAGVAQNARVEAVAVLGRAGLLDDRRTAGARARTLAARDWGDAAIAADLERRGICFDLRLEAIAELEPEPERARRVLERLGARKAAAHLARKGFAEDVVAAAVDTAVADEGQAQIG